MEINFFFDVDGTILPFGKDIPQSALDAFSYAKSLGHRLFFATGRGTREMDSRLQSLPFDGGVYSAGGTVIYKGNEIYERRFSSDEKACILDYVNSFGLDILIQTEDGTYMLPQTYALWRESLERYLGRQIIVPNLLVVDEFPSNLIVNKLLVLSREEKIQAVRENIDKHFTVVDNTVGLPQSLMAEIVLSDITKATGIEHMIDYLKASHDSTVAVGDGANDIEMIEYASIGISMGNGSDELKEKADYITTDIEKDGIKNAILYAISEKV